MLVFNFEGRELKISHVKRLECRRTSGIDGGKKKTELGGYVATVSSRLSSVEKIFSVGETNGKTTRIVRVAT